MAKMVGQKYKRLKAPVEFDNLIKNYQLKLKDLGLSKFKTQIFIAQINQNLILNRYKFEIEKRKRKNPLDRIKITLPL